MESRKLLSELNTEELEALFTVNSKLRELASEQAQTDALFWIDEYLESFRNIRGIDYNIGYPANYMTIRPTAYKDFLEAAAESRRKFELWKPETVTKLERAAARIEVYEDASAGYIDMTDANFNRLEKWLANIIDSAAAELAQDLGQQLDYSYTDAAALEALEITAENIGNQYETDGIFLYETEVRKYA